MGLNPPEQYYSKYPHELSGGERQRVNIARSVVLNPELLILDEPTSMLDVSLRAGILNLLEEIKINYDMSILFITHDLATARHLRDRVIPKGDVADSINPPPGCRFHPRCPFAEEKCRVERPQLRELKEDRWVACHFPLIDDEE